MSAAVLMPRKRIRFAKEQQEICPECGAPTMFLNVGETHYEVCHPCRKFQLYGKNLFSGWRDEPPEQWQANADLLKTYSEFATDFEVASMHRLDDSVPF